MRYTKERQREHMGRIRRVLVLKSDATIFEVKEALNTGKNPIDLDKDYVNKMIKKIKRERNKRFESYTVGKVLAAFQDEVEELKKNLWLIINEKKASDKNKVAAIRELRNSSKDLFDKMFDSGVFEKKLGQVKVGLFDYVQDKQDKQNKENENENRNNDSNSEVAENEKKD